MTRATEIRYNILMINMLFMKIELLPKIKILYLY